MRFKVIDHRLYENGKPVPFDNSPNWRGYINPCIAVAHFTGDIGQGGLSWLCKSRGKQAVSAHLWISRQGEVRQLVRFNCRAWHAGASEWEGREDCNSFSIGIEMEGTGKDWPELQIKALIEVLIALHKTYPLEATVGHDEIAVPPGRKPDPGPNFPWDRITEAMIEAGFGE